MYDYKVKTCTAGLFDEVILNKSRASVCFFILFSLFFFHKSFRIMWSFIISISLKKLLHSENLLNVFKASAAWFQLLFDWSSSSSSKSQWWSSKSDIMATYFNLYFYENAMKYDGLRIICFGVLLKLFISFKKYVLIVLIKLRIFLYCHCNRFLSKDSSTPYLCC